MIEVLNLRKSFGNKIAVANISFQVSVGEVLGFLGPNGAGKTTTMRMITGFLFPDAGTARINGFDILRNPVKAKANLGYLPENAPAYSDMQVRNFLEFCAKTRGLQGPSLRKAVDSAIEACFLQPVLQQSIETLSKGYRHRVGLAQAILHDPPALILDEPTDGLDPNQKHEIRQLIRRMGHSKAIIFSTHILEEVEAACTRAIIIDRGQIVANGSPAQLKARSRSAGIILRLAEENQTSLCSQTLQNLPQVHQILHENNSLRIRPKPDVSLHNLSLAITQTLANNPTKFELLELRIEEGRLDEVFREITTPDTTQN
ncbi:MAG: ATP-binding cassette domain-containing protein [Chthoniobacterales bacterium]|nr:ATP-binding cassette domain-containing protein [Chthoniobacterales bacterium]